ncbi:MAG: hypothetical protein ACRDRI_00800 [Pseudonocardiaceae bacterium]
MHYFDKAVGQAVNTLYSYILGTGSKAASTLRENVLRGETVNGTDWIHRSYRDLVTIPFADLAQKGDIKEIERRVGGQFKNYYNTDDINTGIRRFGAYMRFFDDAHRLLLGETPQKGWEKEWKECCDDADEVNKQLEILNASLDQLGSLIKETVSMSQDCGSDPTCLKGVISEWNEVMECAQRIDGPDE